MDKARLALVTSTDCDLPRADVSKRRHRGFVDERSLLEAPGVAAWFATNPNDHLLGAHPKLKAVPLGVQHRGKWSSLLDGREARNRTNLLACCCLSSHPVPSQSEAPGAPKPHASFKTLDDPLRKEFEDQSKMLSAEGLQFKYAREGWVGSVYGRIRRYAVVELCARMGLGRARTAGRRARRGGPTRRRRSINSRPICWRATSRCRRRASGARATASGRRCLRGLPLSGLGRVAGHGRAVFRIACCEGADWRRWSRPFEGGARRVLARAARSTCSPICPTGWRGSRTTSIPSVVVCHA